jgi:hypothetical protein
MTAFDLRAVAWSATQSRFQLGRAPFRTFPRRMKQSSFLAKCRGFRIWGSAVAACTLLVACFLNAWLADVLAQPLGSKQQQLAQSRPDQAQAEPTQPEIAQLTVPRDDVLLILIRASLIALNQANVTGNYTVLRDLGAPSFKEANSADKLAQIFASMRQRNLDLALALLIQPKLYRKPVITPSGMLRITGFFPTDPERITFDLMFSAVKGRWRLFGLSVDVARPQQTPAAQAAPQAAPANEPEEVAPAKPAAEASKKKTKAPTSSNSPKNPSGTEADIRDRLDNPPSPPAEEPKEKSWWNPFDR